MPVNYVQLKDTVWKIVNSPFRLLKYFLGQRWVRFGLVGLAATVSYFLLGILFVNIMRLPVLVGNAAAYALSFIVSYLGQCLWTFEAKGSHSAMLIKFGITQLIGLGINSLIIKILMYYSVTYIVAMLAAIVITPIFVYLVCKYWVFRKTANTAGDAQ